MHHNPLRPFIRRKVYAAARFGPKHSRGLASTPPLAMRTLQIDRLGGDMKGERRFNELLTIDYDRPKSIVELLAIVGGGSAPRGHRTGKESSTCDAENVQARTRGEMRRTPP